MQGFVFETIQKLQGSQADQRVEAVGDVFETIQKLQGSQAATKTKSS